MSLHQRKRQFNIPYSAQLLHACRIQLVNYITLNHSSTPSNRRSNVSSRKVARATFRLPGELQCIRVTAAYARRNVIPILPMGSLNQAKCRTRSPCARITSESTKRFLIKFSLDECTLTIIRWAQFWFSSTQYKPYFPWRQTEFIILSNYGSSHKTERKLILFPNNK